MKRTIGPLFAVLAAVIWLSGCSGSSSGPSTFVRTDQSGAMTISWTDDGNGHLVGSWQSAQPNADSSADLLKTVNVSFTGTLHAGQISIVVSELLVATSTWTGSLSGDALTLNIPQPDGSVAPATFARGNVSDYNSAVSTLRDQATEKRAKASADAAAAADAQASASAGAAAASALTEADRKVSEAIVTLKASLTDGLSFDGFTTNMAALQTDLELTRADALKATTAGAEARANMDACGDASTAQGDASSVGGDESAIGGDQSAAQPKIDSLSREAQDLRDAQAAMKAAYQQQGLTPSASEAPVLGVLHSADMTIKAWKAKVSDYVATAHNLATQAIQIADAAAKAVC
jgi:hypothetical protein